MAKPTKFGPPANPNTSGQTPEPPKEWHKQEGKTAEWQKNKSQVCECRAGEVLTVQAFGQPSGVGGRLNLHSKNVAGERRL